ncbi:MULTISPECIES: hypothetical protein [Dehalobacter]|jgi:hypothetical protein|uniref:Uncharacterized protein n=2 Tax=Dehalobacter restrictus TaxID=55583 RepID=A0A857DFW6_9FIRM|nr:MULTISPECIES: hypothetical protein [Dehalobacter]AHF09063.1 hypothetical protein DEHRE_02295 [Dehalobacter restrictus DSM 9455]MCG1024486.1 hypothetical protein [Dehalobacter sp.]MDJ0304861.1 hypothetical protein [Dehalobacter sp.]QGZ99600.1 hypothetical protein GQ588_02515 [Dehalobacter restrictus]
MKTVMKPIEVIASFKVDGMSTPLKFRIQEQDSPTIIKVEHVCFRSEDKLAGNKMITFQCQSTINGLLKVFELKFEPSTGKWFLFKI